MFFNYDLESDDEDQWIEGLESDDDEQELNQAVNVKDPISSLNLPHPIVFEEGTSVDHALKALQGKQQNCVLIVKNEKLSGILTERDILLKITGKGYDLDIITVDEVMTPNPEYLNPENPIAYALNKMHVGGFRHVPIVDDSVRPLGLISIADIISTIADYFSREIINLPSPNRLVDPSQPEGG
tara:strand:+ start:114 stop:665 length:552 start_codon:yes stop_codon:yes gene_type:complete